MNRINLLFNSLQKGVWKLQDTGGPECTVDQGRKECRLKEGKPADERSAGVSDHCRSVSKPWRLDVASRIEGDPRGSSGPKPS